MRRQYWFLFVIMLLVATAAFAVNPPSRMAPLTSVPMIGGSQDPMVTNGFAYPRPGGGRTLDNPVGVIYPAGTTWYDYQHNGSAGKMVGVDDDGFVHVVWMNATTNDPLNGPRQVNYNLWDPSSQTMQFLTG